MIKRYIISFLQKYKAWIFLIVWSGMIVSCASVASPTGGDYDFDPPVVIKVTPAFNATNVTSNKIEIVFDELVQLESPQEKVIVTPPQIRTPIIQAISNKVKVELRDTLLPNTTYTIDFTDAIADYNEKNALENFSISFSTGDIVDSLSISGKVLTANNLEPVKGIYVGLHSDLNDTAFIKKTFERISRTNERGEFTIRGIAEGNYRLYALNDQVSRSYKYQNPGDEIAFLDSIIVPSHIRAFEKDTVFTADNSVDTVIDVGKTRFIPDNIVLRTFVSAFQRQYLQKTERPENNKLMIYFGGKTALPLLEPLNFGKEKNWALLERTEQNDTLQFWLIDPEIVEMDTISLRMTYQKTDSLNNIVTAVDTLNFVNRKKRQSDNKKKDKEETITFLQLTSNLKSTMNVYDNVFITFDQPVSDFNESKFRLQRFIAADSTYVDENIQVVVDSLNPRQYSFRPKWQPGNSYRFSVDSTSFHSYSGLWSDKFSMDFKIKNLNEYGNLYIDIRGIEADVPAFVELLDKSDKPIRKSTVKDGGVLFMNLDPGTYYARIIIDENGNDKWDTGDYYTKRQPEMVYYYPGSLVIKEYWDIELDPPWTVNAVSLDRQKPLDITKNKPKEKESKRKELEKRDQQNQNREDERRRQEEINSNPSNASLLVQ